MESSWAPFGLPAEASAGVLGGSARPSLGLRRESPGGGMAAWGELGLTGDIRAVGRSAIRRAEVERLTDGPILEPGIGATHISETLSVLG